MRKLLASFLFSCIFMIQCLTGQLKAEAFGNNMLLIPKIGATFFDLPFAFQTKPWGLSTQYSFGTAFTQAIDYRWFWVVETSLALGKVKSQGLPYISSFAGGAGLKFNILQEDFRPHLGMLLHYLHFLGKGVSFMPLNLNTPIFLGLKTFIGMEWIFYSEMSLITDFAYGFYININEPFRQALFTSLAFAFYF